MLTINGCCRFLFIPALLLLSACTAMQTTYFRVGYVELAKADAPGFIPSSGTPKFVQVDDMAPKARAMYNEGYAMLGYSQFVSPLLVSLAESYSTKYAAQLGAEYVVMQTPRQGESNLHAFLVTYWSRVKPEQFSFGGYFQGLPDDLIKRIGDDLNLIIVLGVVPGTPAAAAGLQASDVVLAVNDVRMQKVETFVQAIDKNQGKDIALSVSRQGKVVDLTVAIAKPAALKGPSGVSYYDQPWLNTQPTDWSALSAANTVQASIAAQQQMAQQRELEAQRRQLAAQQYLNKLQSKQISAQENSGRRLSNSRHLGLPTPSRDEQLRNYKKFIDAYSSSWNSPSAGLANQRQQKMDIWFNNAPNIYGQLFTFSMPPPM